jgi:hypothetical protein
MAPGTLRIDVDEAHLSGSQGFFQLSIKAGIAEPGFFGAPVNGFVGFPNIFSASTKSQGFETHGFQGNVAGEDEEVGPGDAIAIFLFDGPEETSGFVKVGVIGPTIQGCEALGPCGGSATPIKDPIGTSTVPGHPNHQAPVMPPISRPPILRSGHQLSKVPLESIIIQL